MKHKITYTGEYFIFSRISNWRISNSRISNKITYPGEYFIFSRISYFVFHHMHLHRFVAYFCVSSFNAFAPFCGQFFSFQEKRTSLKEVWQEKTGRTHFKCCVCCVRAGRECFTWGKYLAVFRIISEQEPEISNRTTRRQCQLQGTTKQTH